VVAGILALAAVLGAVLVYNSFMRRPSKSLGELAQDLAKKDLEERVRKAEQRLKEAQEAARANGQADVAAAEMEANRDGSLADYLSRR